MDAARRLRRDATEAERKLWAKLRGKALGVRFRRHFPVPPFVVDFASVEVMLVVEVDGGQHGGNADARRDAALSAAGWHVLRFWNDAVTRNTEGVVAMISEAVSARLRR